jgi:hypothetical protein
MHAGETAINTEGISTSLGHKMSLDEDFAYRNMKKERMNFSKCLSS